MSTKTPLLTFLKNDLLQAEKPQNKHILFEVGDSAETTTYFFQLLKIYLQKQWGILFTNSKMDYEANLFCTNSKAVWFSNFTSEVEEETACKSSLKDALLCSIPNITFILVKKVLTKDTALLVKHNFTIVSIEQKRFCLSDFYNVVGKLLNLETPKQKHTAILATFGTSSFSELDQLVSFVSSLSVLSINNFATFKKTYTPFFFKENCFKLTQHLLGDKSNSAKFFTLWREIKDDLPVQFWTAFLMNRTWTSLQACNKSNTSVFEKLKKLYIDLYLADLSSKQIGSYIFLETIFYTYFTR